MHAPVVKPHQHKWYTGIPKKSVIVMMGLLCMWLVLLVSVSSATDPFIDSQTVFIQKIIAGQKVSFVMGKGLIPVTRITVVPKQLAKATSATVQVYDTAPSGVSPLPTQEIFRIFRVTTNRVGTVSYQAYTLRVDASWLEEHAAVPEVLGVYAWQNDSWQSIRPDSVTRDDQFYRLQFNNKTFELVAIGILPPDETGAAVAPQPSVPSTSPSPPPAATDSTSASTDALVPENTESTTDATVDTSLQPIDQTVSVNTSQQQVSPDVPSRAWVFVALFGVGLLLFGIIIAGIIYTILTSRKDHD